MYRVDTVFTSDAEYRIIFFPVSVYWTRSKTRYTDTKTLKKITGLHNTKIEKLRVPIPEITEFLHNLEKNMVYQNRLNNSTYIRYIWIKYLVMTRKRIVQEPYEWNLIRKLI